MTTIAPNDPNILFSPYTWKLGADYTATVSSGAYLKATIDGSPADLTMLFNRDSATATPPIAYRVDDGPWIRTPLNATSIALTLNAEWPSHTVELVLALRGNGVGGDPWVAPPLGALRFAGFSSSSVISTRPVYVRPLRGFALGDSLAMGIYTLGSDNDVRFAWAYPLCDALGAEVGVRAFGGVALTQAGDGGVPAFGTIWDQLWDGQPADFATAPPDFIALMPGTNDAGADDATVTAAAVALLNDMLASTPSTCQIILVRNWKGMKATAIQAAIAGTTAPARVHWVDTTGWVAAGDTADTTHPYGYANINATVPRLAGAIRSILAGASNPTSFWWNGTTWLPTAAA